MAGQKGRQKGRLPHPPPASPLPAPSWILVNSRNVMNEGRKKHGGGGGEGQPRKM